MKSSLIRKLLVAAALCASAASAGAEDIDIYQANNTSATSNLLLVIDNSGAWNASAPTTNADPAKNCPSTGVSKIIDSTLANSSGGVETCGIWKAVDAIGNTPALLGKLNMGLMLFSEGSTQGGTFKFPKDAAPTALVNMDAGGIGDMKSVLTGLKSSGPSSNTANGTDVGGAMQEAWAFYTGRTGMSGTTYKGINADTCGKNFVIFIGISRVSSDPADSNANRVFEELKNAGASAEQQTYINWTTNNKYSKSTNYWGDEWVRFSKQNNAITTYTITLVDPGNPNPDYERFMKSMADASGGKAFVVDVSDITGFVQALLQIFNEIQAVNSVFAAASLPISTNATGSFLNQIYFGMFRPDAAGLPRWAGNLKQYRFALDRSNPLNPTVYLADARPNDPLTGRPYPAINSAGTGFFSPNAVSYWTSKDINTLPDSIDPTGSLSVNGGVAGGYFIFNPQSAGGGFDLPDGEIVEKGGVAQRVRLENLLNDYATAPGSSTNPRRLYTCTSGTTTCGANSLLSDTPFATTNDGITDALLGSGIPGTPITSIVRVGTVGTVTLSSAMSPAPFGGQQITLTNTGNVNYNSTFIVSASPAPTATSFTITAPTVPPATSVGTYTASIPGVTAGVTIVRQTGTTARVTYAGHPFTNNQVVSVTSSDSTANYTGYTNTNATITYVDANTFDYSINVGPPATGGGATAAATLIEVTNSSGATTTGASRIIETTVNGGIQRATPNNTSPFNATVTIVTTSNLPNTIVVNDWIKISGLIGADTPYNGVWQVTALGNSCPGSGTNQKKLCFSISTTPLQVAPSLAGTAATTSLSSTVTLTRPSSCTVANPGPVSRVTATSSTAHGFTVGQTVGISGVGSPPANEALYQGNFVIQSVTTTAPHTFTYDITTDPPCTVTNVPNAQASALGVDRTTLIRWVRGHDNRGDEAAPGGTVTVRPSVHGDVLHSRPAVVNYGGSIGVVAFYGDNSGVFHAVNGNQTAAIGSVPAGGELWGFVASEFFNKLKRQYLNTPVVKLEATAGSILPTPQPKDYFFDGSIGVYKNGSTVHLYLTARRGGRVIYALDVTDPTAPRFMWKKTNTSDSGAFSEMGQTWSTPKIVTVKGHSNPVLIMGAGYDPAEDAEPPAARTMGRGIFILDAITGAMLWKATTGGAAGTTTCKGTACAGGLDMAYPIPSDVVAIDRDTTDAGNYTDRVYVGDLGGNVWRVDLEPVSGNTPAHWQVTKFASVGGSGTTKRKLFFPPDVVPTTSFDAVLFATGDREHPTRTQQSVNILNRFYMLKDTQTGNDACPLVLGVPTCSTTITDSTSSTACTPSNTGAAKTAPGGSNGCTEAVPSGLFNSSPVLPTTASVSPAKLGNVYDDSGNGFYVNLLNALPHVQSDQSTLYGPEIQAGEKAVNAPTTIGGNTFFGTNSPVPPDPGVCQPNLGTARGYAISFLTGALNFAIFDGGGLPPSPVAGTVDIDGLVVPFIVGGVPPPKDDIKPGDDIGGKTPSPLDATKVEITVKAVRTRTYWYRDLGNR